MSTFDNPDEWFNGTVKKTGKSAGAAGGFTVPSFRKVSSSNETKTKTLNAIKATNANKPQVMVKITGSSKGTDKAQAHAKYIGRNGKIEIENELGEKFKGRDEQKELLKAWEALGLHTTNKTGTRKEAFHIVFSMPQGTNPDGLKTAVKNLVQDEFSGHKYFMAQHLDTDSPHVHVLLSATDDRGARLNPRKADLHNYRVQFVQKLAEQGIEATASRKIHRFNYKDNKPQGIVKRDERRGYEKGQTKPNYESKRKIDKAHNQVKEFYKEYESKLPENQTELKSEINKLIKSQEKDKGKGR